MSRTVLAMVMVAGGLLAQGGHVLPAGFDVVEGSRGNAIPFAHTPHRYQQVLPGADLAVATVDVRAIAARPDGGVAAPGGIAVEVEVLMGTTARDFQGMSASFDQNYGSAPTVVFASKHVDLPGYSAVPGPQTFDVVLYLDRPFTFAKAAGNLLLEVKVHGNGNGNKAFNYLLDAVWNGRETIPAKTTRVYSSGGPGDATGTVGSGYGIVWLLMTGTPPATAYRYGSGCVGAGGLPLVSLSAAPRLGASLNVHLSRAAGTAACVLWVGPSRDSFRGVSLPLDLTPMGAGGCRLLVGGVDFQAALTDAGGNAAVPMVLPNDVRLTDGRFFVQWLVMDVVANAAGMVASGGIEAAMR